ncbi:MAG TPA: chloride channel protein [Gemmatimonadales bacterium]|nr:chloride channel protein [Gemmatimonadales bacterium]
MTSTPDGLPVAPSMGPALASAGVAWQPTVDHHRILIMSGLAVLVGFSGAAAAEILLRLINLATNFFFFHRFSIGEASPADNHVGLLVLLIPVFGGIIVGIMARYGSAAIRGHGIPEAMERVLYGESKVSPAVTFFKPISSAIAIGTGGPFGAEGPIIATGGALGSLLGQVLRTTADERKVLLAAGAAAGMAATFGSPVSAVLLAIELLLFEYRARSLVPVALAACTATAVRMALRGTAPIFSMPIIGQPTGTALVTYVLLGAVIGYISVLVTRGLYKIEDGFEHLPVHWMWWPAIGAVAVGAIGYFVPHTLGVGYDNIHGILAGNIVGTTLVILVVAKFVSWSIALGSGTSGGTLAPLFTIGGGLGALFGGVLLRFIPALGVDPRVAALVGMAAIFAGASRALLASVVFAFETTRQPLGLLPLLAGCTGAFLVSLLRMRSTIMTERLERRGAPVQTEYAADYLSQVLVRDCASTEVTTIEADRTVESARVWLASGEPGTTHQGYPVVQRDGTLLGVVMKREIEAATVDGSRTVGSLVKRPPAIIYDTQTARNAADHMVREGIGRLPVVRRVEPTKVVAILTRSDLLEAHERRLDAATKARRGIKLYRSRPRV